MSSVLLVDAPTSTPKCSSRKYANAGRWLALTGVGALMAAAVWLRVWNLGHIPGINGDEAEYAVRAVRLLRGEPIVWHTPTKNLVNPFYFGPLVALHAVWSPSFVLLRVTAVASGLLALVLNYLFCRRAFGARMAVVSTTVLAVLPVNIAYSRFGWDTCQTMAASMLVIYPAILAVREPRYQGRWILLGIVGLGMAYLVHPTNVFLGAFLVAVVIVERGSGWLQRQPGRKGLIFGSLVVATGVAAAYWGARHVMTLAPADLGAPVELAEFARNYVRLFSGTTIYRYIPGSMLPRVGMPWDVDWYDGVAVLVMTLLGGAFVRCWWKQRDVRDWVLACGWGVGVTGFFVVAGAHALEPHWERYGICLVAPGALVMSRGLVELMSGGARPGRWVVAGGLLCGAMLLAQFERNYMRFFERTGGESQETFRTGRVEPKLAAWREVSRARDPERMTWIVVPTWWNYWPLAYLASEDEQVGVMWWEEAREDERVLSALEEGRVWFVEYCDSPGWKTWRAWFEPLGGAGETSIIQDYGGRPVLSVVHVTGARRGIVYLPSD